MGLMDRGFASYSAFQIDELHRHNQSLVGTLHATSLLLSADMKTAVIGRGGTNFCLVLVYLEEHRDYDSLMITTWAGMFTWKKILLTYIPHVKM